MAEKEWIKRLSRGHLLDWTLIRVRRYLFCRTSSMIFLSSNLQSVYKAPQSPPDGYEIMRKALCKFPFEFFLHKICKSEKFQLNRVQSPDAFSINFTCSKKKQIRIFCPLQQCCRSSVINGVEAFLHSNCFFAPLSDEILSSAWWNLSHSMNRL